MATGGTSVFVIADPSVLEKGVCTRCGNWRPGWGVGYRGEACVKTQHMGGEVSCDICGRCNGTGVEPAHFVWDGLWYKPWTWLRWHYEDVFGVTQPKPKAFRTERHN